MSLAIILVLAVVVLILSGFVCYLYYLSKQLELSAARLANHARSEIEYLESKCESKQQIIDQVNYHDCADWLEELAKKREEGAEAVNGLPRASLVGQSKGLFEAATHLRQEARRMGLRKK